MSKTIACRVAALMLTAFGQPKAPAQKIESPPVSLCSIVASPEQFDGKEITITARYEADVHTSILTGDNCSRGIGLSAPRAYRGETAFEKAINTGEPGTFDKIITGIFIGTFIWQPEKNPKAILILKEVRDVSVRPK